MRTAPSGFAPDAPSTVAGVWWPRLVLAGVVAVAALAGCSGSNAATVPRAKTVAPPVTSTRATAAPPSFRVVIVAATHRPRANAKWPVTVRVTNAAGKPIAARLTMQILFAGSPVGKVDNGRLYRFVGSWQEKPGQEITWPAAAIGQPLTFEALVTARGETRKADYPIRVRR